MPSAVLVSDADHSVQKKLKEKSCKHKSDKKDKKDKSKKSEKSEKSDQEKILKKAKKSEKSDDQEKKDKKDKKSEKEKKEKKEKKRLLEEEEEPEKKQKVHDPSLLENFKLETCISNALKETGVTSLFPIQIASFDPVIQGKDVLGRARTGTGKTLAFSLPIVQKLHQSISKARGRAPKALIMAPTRELAIQVYKQVQVLSTNQLKVTCVYGGVPYDSQYIAFRDGIDIVVGTPGRLIDHIDRGNLKLFNLE